MAEKIKEVTKIKNTKSSPTNKKLGFGGFLKKNWILILIIIYAISPLDFIPEAILGPFGLTEDLGLLIAELVRRAVTNKD